MPLYYRMQRITYPSLKAGEKISMAITLEENLEYWITQGEKVFHEEYFFSNKYKKEVKGDSWDKINSCSGISAVVTDITPHVPEPSEFQKELGLSNMVLVHFNYPGNMFNMRQDIGDISTEWNSYSDHFPGVIYLSPQGNDAWDGSREKPYKTIKKAFDEIRSGDTIMLDPGTYSVSGLTYWAPYTKIMGTAPGVILKGTPDKASVLHILKTANELVLKDLTIDGGKEQGLLVDGANNVRIEGVKVINSGGPGIHFKGSLGLLKNCEIANTGKLLPEKGDGILVEKSNNVKIEGCNIHDVKANGVNIQYESPRQSYIDISGCTISRCGKSGIQMSGYMGTIRNCFIRDTDWARDCLHHKQTQ